MSHFLNQTAANIRTIEVSFESLLIYICVLSDKGVLIKKNVKKFNDTDVETPE